MCERLVVHTASRSGDDSVGLIGQDLLSFIDGVNPSGFDKVQIAVLHQGVFKRVVPALTGHHELHLLRHVVLDNSVKGDDVSQHQASLVVGEFAVEEKVLSAQELW